MSRQPPGKTIPKKSAPSNPPLFCAAPSLYTGALKTRPELGISQRPDPAVSGRSLWKPGATFPPWPEPGDDLFRKKKWWELMIWNTELHKARLICVSSRFQSEGGTLPSGRWSRNSLHPLPAPRPRCLKAARQPQVREAWHIVVVESLELTWPRTLGKKVFKRILLLFVLISWFRVSLPSKCQGPISHSNFQHNAESMRSQLGKKRPRRPVW